MVGLVVFRIAPTPVTLIDIGYAMDMLRLHHVAAANTKENVLGYFQGEIPRKWYSIELVIPVPCCRLRWALLASSLDQIFIALAPSSAL